MADQFRWFKLWTSCLSDRQLSDLDISDFGRWVKLGAYMRAEGKDGTLMIQPPARFLCHILQCDDFDSLIQKLASLPGLDIENVTSQSFQNEPSRERHCSVTFKNWRRWQVTPSALRMRKMREKKRHQSDVISSPSPSSSIPNPSLINKGRGKKQKSEPSQIAVSVLNHLNEKAERSYQPTESNLSYINARIQEDATEEQLKSVIDKKAAQWKNDPKMDQFLRPSTLFNKKHFQEYLNEKIIVSSNGKNGKLSVAQQMVANTETAVEMMEKALEEK